MIACTASPPNKLKPKNQDVRATSDVLVVTERLTSRPDKLGGNYLDVRATSDVLDVTPWWVRKLIASGELRAINVGGPDKSARWRVHTEDLAAFVKRRENRRRDLNQ